MNKPTSLDRCVYLGRVSTPRQTLEHQRESVLRFADTEGISLPESAWFEDKVRRHKQLTEGKNFIRLMEMVKAHKIDWIIIATFDRWGIKEIDDISVWRKELRKYDCKLWSVADELDITGTDDGTFWRVAARAEAATGYVSAQADKNIQKMVTMATQGWATTGNNPFGLDLVCYPLDMSRPLFRVVRMRWSKPHLYRVIHYEKDGKTVSREESVQFMPPRDKKATGYRFAPSLETDRIKAVKLMFSLFAEGMDEAQISDNLWKQGLGHYGKPFGYHGVQSILANPAYIGKPAFGKIGVGQYKITVNKQPAKVQRKSTDTFVIVKPKDQWIMPAEPLFEPIIDPALFEKVQERFAKRQHVNPAYGKRRSRDRVAHPLNGKVICPDCKMPMVRGSSTPKGKKKKLSFVCGTYRRTIRTQCHANSVSWDMLDRATEELLQTVKGRIESITTGAANIDNEDWLKKTELGNIIRSILLDLQGGPTRLPNGGWAVPMVANGYEGDDADKPIKKVADPDTVVGWYEEAFAEYDHGFEARAKPLRQELVEIEERLDALGELMVIKRKFPTIIAKYDAEAGELEARKAEIQPQLVPLTDQARAIVDQLVSIRNTIEGADKAKKASILDSFLEAVYPILDVKEVGKGKEKKRRASVTGFRFVPRKEAEKVLADEMKVLVSRTGTGSSRPRARSWPGTSSNGPPARWSRALLRAAAARLRGCGG